MALLLQRPRYLARIAGWEFAPALGILAFDWLPLQIPLIAPVADCVGNDDGT